MGSWKMVESVLAVDPEDCEYAAKVSWNENRILSVEKVCGNPGSILSQDLWMFIPMVLLE
jgi:hypothetical protein